MTLHPSQHLSCFRAPVASQRHPSALPPALRCSVCLLCAFSSLFALAQSRSPRCYDPYSPSRELILSCTPTAAPAAPVGTHLSLAICPSTPSAFAEQTHRRFHAVRSVWLTEIPPPPGGDGALDGSRATGRWQKLGRCHHYCTQCPRDGAGRIQRRAPQCTGSTHPFGMGLVLSHSF